MIISEDQHLNLNAIALKKDVSVAWVIRQAITKTLDASGSSGNLWPLKKSKKQGQ
jgi:hypothetical protein